MIKLRIFPKNRDKFERLLLFYAEINDICRALDVLPILEGSLAVFAYTGNQEMLVNDIDLSYTETEFKMISQELTKHHIFNEIKEWHVLQARRGDLKVEFSSIEFWFSDIPIGTQSLTLCDMKVKILSLESLIAYYKKGVENTKHDQSKQEKYWDMLDKLHALQIVRR